MRRWIKVDKDKYRTMPSGIDLLVYDSEKKETYFYKHDQYIPTGRFTHYSQDTSMPVWPPFD